MSSMQERRAAWVAALRGGKYKQAKNVLRRKSEKMESYCPLGVAAELYRKANGLEEEAFWAKRTDSRNAYTCSSGHQDGTLPREVYSWYGLRGPDGPTFDISLTILNDKYNMTFKEIAKIIENFADEIFVSEDPSPDTSNDASPAPYASASHSASSDHAFP